MPARRDFSSSAHLPWEKMRSRLLTPEIPEDLASEILEELASALPYEQYVPSIFDEDITLHDLYDIDPGSDTQDDDLANAVDEYFPEAMILAAENPPPEIAVVDLTTSPAPCGEMPPLTPQDMDLQCYEPMPPMYEDNDDEEVGVIYPQDYTRVMVKQAIDILNETDGDEEEDFQLDAPLNPGHDCKSCRYHREKTGDAGVMCSLCYLRLNAAFVYSKCLMLVVLLIPGRPSAACF